MDSDSWAETIAMRTFLLSCFGLVTLTACGATPAAPAPPDPPPGPAAPKAWERDCIPVANGTTTFRRSTDPKVHNGDAYDCGRLFTTIAKLRVPVGTQVGRTAPKGEITLHTRKSLDFHGHPPNPMNPEVARRNMGLAFQIRADAVTLAAFGEWQSIEGGAQLTLFLNAPPHLVIETSAELSGPDSAAQDRQGAWETSPGYWYASGKPAAGWEPLGLLPEDAWEEAPAGP